MTVGACLLNNRAARLSFSLSLSLSLSLTLCVFVSLSLAQALSLSLSLSRSPREPAQVHTSEAEAAKAKERVVGKVSRSALIKTRTHYESLLHIYIYKHVYTYIYICIHICIYPSIHIHIKREGAPECCPRARWPVPRLLNNRAAQVHTSDAEAAKAKERVMGSPQSGLRPFHPKSTCLRAVYFRALCVAHLVTYHVDAGAHLGSRGGKGERESGGESVAIGSDQGPEALRESARAPSRPEKVTPHVNLPRRKGR